MKLQFHMGETLMPYGWHWDKCLRKVCGGLDVTTFTSVSVAHWWH